MSALRTKAIPAAAVALAMGIAGHFEGYSLLAYLDPIGVPTICRGITAGVKLGDVATPKECTEKEKKAMRAALEIVSRCADVPLRPNEWAAWGSFVYNVGPGRKGVKDGFCILKNGQQPTLLKLLKLGAYEAACEELPKWVKAGGIRFPGLVKRRNTERAICLEDLTS